MHPIGTRNVRRAVEAQAASAGAIALSPSRPKPVELSPLARKIAAEPVSPAISQVVLAGFVRLTEFLALSALGFLIYLLYVHPAEDLAAHYLWTAVAISAAAVFAFQTAELYDVTTMRTRVHQLGRVAIVWTVVFLVALAISF
ncbi:MAG: hypothetical protein WD207_07775, partial [Xanthobacteraceae bacterium]